MKALCESFLSGGSVSKEKLVVLISEHNVAMDLDNSGNNIQNHMDLIKREESEISKKAANSRLLFVAELVFIKSAKSTLTTTSGVGFACHCCKNQAEHTGARRTHSKLTQP